MKVIYEYFINASIQDFIFGVILAAIIIRIVLDILIGDSLFGIHIHKRQKS
jgi:hypothetical protein